jgi:hypothetical protein
MEDKDLRRKVNLLTMLQTRRNTRSKQSCFFVPRGTASQALGLELFNFMGGTV